MIETKEGNILEATETYIAHQCNCVSRRGAGLAQQLFIKFPWSDVYSGRSETHVPKDGEGMGDIIIKGDGKDQRFVIAMLAQYYPGGTYDLSAKRDGSDVRAAAFQQCLEKISKIEGLDSIAFPYKIGSGLAGGSWFTYEAMLVAFAKKTEVKVVIYRRPGD
jgi:O-acetyl-ADP-ribose deacetylase (regulator of RNase III)